MRIGIIVYSQTENTYSVAKELQRELTSVGRNATIERITIVGEPGQPEKKVEFSVKPDIHPYDELIFAAPVQGFNLSVVMKKYLKQLGSLEGKKVHLLTTKQISNKWTGGNRAINLMNKICRSKGASMGETGIIFWKEKHRKRTTDEALSRILKAI
ncbi:MAG: flavodoxin family protein [Thermoplasmata archaeon]|nr:flavodoxin family protein [Thermoplasmata archaeon]